MARPARIVVPDIPRHIPRRGSGVGRFSSEATAQGTVGYSYDADGNRVGMSVNGQPDTAYTYDNAGRLTPMTMPAA